MALHWPNRYYQTAVRIHEIVPENDHKLTRFMRSMTQAFDALLKAEQIAVGDGSQKEPISPYEELQRLGLNYVAACAAFDLDAEIVIEDGIQKYEAKKAPVPEQEPTAPTAVETRKPKKQFTL